MKDLSELIHFGTDHDLAIRVVVLIVVEIPLVIIFGGIEFRERRDLGNDGIIEGAALVELCFVFLRFSFLFFIMIEHRAAVLGAYIGTLLV